MKCQSFAFMSKKNANKFISRLKKELKIHKNDIVIYPWVGNGTSIVDVYWEKNLQDRLADITGIYIEIICPGFFLGS